MTRPSQNLLGFHWQWCLPWIFPDLECCPSTPIASLTTGRTLQRGISCAPAYSWITTVIPSRRISCKLCSRRYDSCSTKSLIYRKRQSASDWSLHHHWQWPVILQNQRQNWEVIVHTSFLLRAGSTQALFTWHIPTTIVKGPIPTEMIRILIRFLMKTQIQLQEMLPDKSRKTTKNIIQFGNEMLEAFKAVNIERQEL